MLNTSMAITTENEAYVTNSLLVDRHVSHCHLPFVIFHHRYKYLTWLHNNRVSAWESGWIQKKVSYHHVGSRGGRVGQTRRVSLSTCHFFVSWGWLFELTVVDRPGGIGPPTRRFFNLKKINFFDGFRRVNPFLTPSTRLFLYFFYFFLFRRASLLATPIHPSGQANPLMAGQAEVDRPALTSLVWRRQSNIMLHIQCQNNWFLIINKITWV